MTQAEVPSSTLAKSEAKHNETPESTLATIKEAVVDAVVSVSGTKEEVAAVVVSPAAGEASSNKTESPPVKEVMVVQ
jgi:hypothetical protein